MTIQERLKYVREVHGKTQKQMAVLLGISPRTWQDYEGGVNVPGWKVLEGLAKLGFNVNWILTDEGDIELTESELESNKHRALIDRLSTLYISGAIPLYEDIEENCYYVGEYKSCITDKKLMGYLRRNYVPTRDELTFLCKMAGDWDFELSKLSPEIEQVEFEQTRKLVELNKRKKELKKLQKEGNKIEVNLLMEVTTEIEMALLNTSIQLDPAKKAELLALVYDYAAESEEKRAGIKEQVKRLLSLVR